MVLWVFIFGEGIVLIETFQVQSKFQIKAIGEENLGRFMVEF